MRKITTEAINDYKNYLFNEEKGEITIEKYIRDINAFNAWINCGELSKSKVLEYKSKLVEEYAPATVNSVLSSLNGFFKYNEWYELQVKSLKIQRRMFCKTEKELSKDEYDRLLKAALDKKNDRLYLIMQTICSMGLRVSELRFITAESIRKGEAVVKLKGKIRTVFIPPELAKMLRVYMREKSISTGSIFVTKTGKPIDRHTIWKCMKELCEMAGVSKEKVFPHNLRHLFARTYYSLQKDIVRLADILGHSSVNTTRIYTIENGDVHRKQMEKLGLVRMLA